MLLAIITTALLFIYAYNFFINYHILIVFISITPLISIPFFKNIPNSSLCLIILLYWGLTYYLFTFIYYSIYTIYIFTWFSYLTSLIKSLSLLHIVLH